MKRRQMEFLDPGRIGSIKGQTALGLGANLAGLGPNQGNRPGTLVGGGGKRPDDVWRPTTGAHADGNIAPLNEGLHLSLKDRLITKIVGKGRQQGSVGGQRQSGERTTFSLIPSHKLGRNVLGDCGTAPVAENHDLATGRQSPGHDLDGSDQIPWILLGEGLGRPSSLIEFGPNGSGQLLVVHIPHIEQQGHRLLDHTASATGGQDTIGN
jgi:hypothetical protein